jgi:hypothetical protein
VPVGNVVVSLYEFIEKYKDNLRHAQRTENDVLCLYYQGAVEALSRWERELNGGWMEDEENISQEV